MQREYFLWRKTCNRDVGEVLVAYYHARWIDAESFTEADHFQSLNKAEFSVPNLQKGIINKKPADIKKDLWEIKIKHKMLPWSSPPCHRSLTCGKENKEWSDQGFWFTVPLHPWWPGTGLSLTSAPGQHPWHELHSFLPFCHFFVLLFTALESHFLLPHHLLTSTTHP